MAGNIKGITIELNGKTNGLQKALEGVNKSAEKSNSELKKVNKALKFNPGNAELVAQKQELLSKQIETTSQKLKILKDSHQEVKEQFDNGKIDAEQYRAFQREVADTESTLKHYTVELDNVQKEHERLGESTAKLEEFFEKTDTSIDDFSDVLGDKLVNSIKKGTASSKDLDKALAKVAKQSGSTEEDVEELKEAIDKLDDGDSVDNVRQEIEVLGDSADGSKEKIDRLTQLAEAGQLQQFAGQAGELSEKIFDFGEKSIESAAKASAMEAQLQQVFGQEYANKANEEIDTLAENLGKLPSQVKSSFTSTVAMFKGLGEETESAMSLASNAVTIASDAAAFYDKSFEDATGSLNAFIKGNYEGGESIGLFANETQIAAFAIKNNLIEASEEQKKHAETSAIAVEKAQEKYSQAVEKYGESSLQARDAQAKLNEAMEKQANGPDLTTKWKTLTEAQKQAIRLDFAKTMQEQSGAMGMAKEEADNYENVMGNLSAVIDEFMAAIGSEALEMFSEILQALIPIIKGIADWFKGLSPVVKQVLTVFIGLSGVVLGLMPIITSIATAFALFGSTALLPIIGIIAGVIAAITALVVVFMNWDNILVGLSATFEWFKEMAINVWNGIAGAVGSVASDVATTVGNMGNTLKEKWQGIKNGASEMWGSVKSTIKEKIDGAKNAVKDAIDAIKGFLKFKWQWPKIPLPHFSFSGSMNPLDWGDPKKRPNIGVEWYAKGGILQRPTVFGMNGNNLMVGGEAGHEAVLPLNRETLSGIGAGIASTIHLQQDTSLLEMMVELLERLLYKDQNTYIDGHELAGHLHKHMQQFNQQTQARALRIKGGR